MSVAALVPSSMQPSLSNLGGHVKRAKMSQTDSGSKRRSKHKCKKQSPLAKLASEEQLLATELPSVYRGTDQCTLPALSMTLALHPGWENKEETTYSNHFKLNSEKEKTVCSLMINKDIGNHQLQAPNKMGVFQSVPPPVSRNKPHPEFLKSKTLFDFRTARGYFEPYVQPNEETAMNENESMRASRSRMSTNTLNQGANQFKSESTYNNHFNVSSLHTPVVNVGVTTPDHTSVMATRAGKPSCNYTLGHRNVPHPRGVKETISHTGRIYRLSEALDVNNGFNSHSKGTFSPEVKCLSRLTEYGDKVSMNKDLFEEEGLCQYRSQIKNNIRDYVSNRQHGWRWRPGMLDNVPPRFVQKRVANPITHR